MILAFIAKIIPARRGASTMSADITSVKTGLAIVLLGLFFGVALGIAFGVNEDAFQDYVAAGIAAHPELHNERSADGIWRYALRAHFHAGGIAAFCLGLIILVMVSDLPRKLRQVSSILISLGSFYPLSWLSMFLLSPSIGRGAAHGHILTEMFTYISVGGLLIGSFILLANLFLGMFKEQANA
jgi:hypothetical protein